LFDLTGVPSTSLCAIPGEDITTLQFVGSVRKADSLKTSPYLKAVTSPQLLYHF